MRKIYNIPVSISPLLVISERPFIKMFYISLQSREEQWPHSGQSFILQLQLRSSQTSMLNSCVQSTDLAGSCFPWEPCPVSNVNREKKDSQLPTKWSMVCFHPCSKHRDWTNINSFCVELNNGHFCIIKFHFLISSTFKLKTMAWP